MNDDLWMIFDSNGNYQGDVPTVEDFNSWYEESQMHEVTDTDLFVLANFAQLKSCIARVELNKVSVALF